MQCACAIVSSVACPALQYFSTFSHKRHDFREKKVLNTKCVFWFRQQLLSETFLIIRRNGRDMIIGLHVKYPLLLSDFNETWIFSTDFRQILPNIKFHENPSSWSLAFQAGGRTDITKLIVAFRNFANAPPNEDISLTVLKNYEFDACLARTMYQQTSDVCVNSRVIRYVK